MRIAIVNDLAIAVEALRRTVRAIPGASVAWVARDGAQAVAECARDRPDLVLMDLVMPGMDGVEATRQIMRASPCPVLVVTASVRGNVGKVYEALGHGALDAVATPRLGLGGGLEGAAELRRKIETVGALSQERALALPVQPAGAPHSGRAAVPPLIAIGASTGGPRALAEILAVLPADLPAAVAVVQHIDRLFAPGLARWLDRRTPLSVAALSAPEPLRAGHVWVAAGEGHLVVGDDLRLTLVPEPVEHLHCPSIDVFFASAAHRLPLRGIGVLLTGMGRDGAHGLLALRHAGYHTIAQDERSSVVWGMPRAGAEAGGAVEVLPLEKIGPRILALIGRGARA